MKYLSTIGMCLLVGGVGDVMAQCNSGRYDLLGSGDLANTRISAVASGGEEWKEDHCGTGNSGNLYKWGGDPATDPYALRGTWSFNSATSGVTYNYGAGGTYTWRVLKNKTTGGLCWDEGAGSGSNIIATSPSPGAASPCTP